MQRSSWCQCQAFCLPFRTSLDPECPKIAKSSNQLKDMMVFFEPYEEFECLNNVLVPKSYPSYHPNQGTHSDSVLPIPKCQVQVFIIPWHSHPSNLHHLSTPLLQLCPFPCHPWTGDDYGWSLTGLKINKYSTTSIWNHQHHSLWFWPNRTSAPFSSSKKGTFYRHGWWSSFTDILCEAW